MEQVDIAVVGGGISGMAFAWHAAEAGGTVRVFEADERVGGCLHSARLSSGFWFELGAHTCYNSYGGLIELIEGAGIADKLRGRVKVPFRMRRDGELQSIARQMHVVELFTSAWRIFGATKEGRTVADYYGAIVGRGNYARFLSAFLAAVPCQNADAFPATMLFKKRPRRKDILRSFTLEGGLQTVCEAIGRHERIRLSTGIQVIEAEPEGGESTSDDRGWTLTLASGETLHTRLLALAVPPRAAAAILRPHRPALAEAIDAIATAHLHSTGVVVATDKVKLEPVAGIVPADDIFHSAVSRDIVPDPRWRGFTFHFKPGTDGPQRLARICEVLGVQPAAIEARFDQPRTLPAPVLGHDAQVAAIEALLPEAGVYLTGNWFGGMAIEDCVSRSKAEVARMCGAGA